MTTDAVNLVLKVDLEDIPIMVVSTWIPRALVSGCVKEDGFLERWAAPLLLITAVGPMVEAEDQERLFAVMTNIMHQELGDGGWPDENPW